VPTDHRELRVLLDAFQMEKAVHEARYELNNRPDWLKIPLHGIEQILNLPQKESARQCDDRSRLSWANLKHQSEIIGSH
jgi:hypothetical protein